MMISPSYSELRQMSGDELVARYDALAANTQVGISFIRDELWRREVARQADRMEELTRRIYWFTVVVTLATIVNVFVAVWPIGFND